MTGLVLAAGIGKRLAPLTDDCPKGLIELGGRSLLARLLDGLAAAGVQETCLVVGYRHELIRAHLGGSHRGMPLRYLENEAYTRGPRLSLWTGRGAFAADDVVLADGDVLFAPALLARVIGAGEANVFLGEPELVDTGEEQILYSTAGRVVALRRGVMGPPVTPYQARAEWVGFAKIGRAAGRDLAATLEAMVGEGRVDGDYEVALDALLPRHRFAVCSTEGLPWIEIDFPQDLHAAEHEVLPRIARLEAGTT
jgi:choline kinase